MIKPDTTTMEGRHIVERASRMCRIQFRAERGSDEWLCSEYGNFAYFNWAELEYRIHPDDLDNLPDDLHTQMVRAREREETALEANEQANRTIARLTNERLELLKRVEE